MGPPCVGGSARTPVSTQSLKVIVEVSQRWTGSERAAEKKGESWDPRLWNTTGKCPVKHMDRAIRGSLGPPFLGQVG